MKRIFLLISIFIVVIVSAENATTENNETTTSSTTNPSSTRKLNADVRNALLEAIDKLERQGVESDENNSNNDSAENHETITESSTLNLIPTVQFFTASAEDTSQDNNHEGDIILKTILKNVSPKAKELLNTESSSNENDEIKIHFISTSAVKNKNAQQPRSISSESSNEISQEIKTKYITPTTIRPKLNLLRRKTTTVTTTTTSTTPKPTHNEDGENIEVVEKKDVKIFRAPLVTAFSVQQDDKGSLKKVIPLLNEAVATSTTIEPLIKPIFSGNAIIEKLKVTATNVSNLLLPTPLPTQQSFTRSTPNSISNEPKGIPLPTFLRSNPYRPSETVFQPTITQDQQQNLFSSQQSPPLRPAQDFNSNFQSLNNYLLERQRYLEQQILQLQIQARQQQEQILLQQRLLEEQRRLKAEESERINHINTGVFKSNQVNPIKNFKTSSTPSFTVRPSLEIIPSITQPPKFELSHNHQHHTIPFLDNNLVVPNKEAANFHPNFIPINNNHLNQNSNNNNHLQQRSPPSSSIQIQSSNQFNLNPPPLPQAQQNHFIPHQQSPPLVSSPLELSPYQQLPHPKSIQPFKSVQFQHQQPTNAFSDQSPRTRHFRQESGVGNFGTSNTFLSSLGDFQRSRNVQTVPSASLIFQPGSISSNYNNYEDFSIISKVLALNHGISPFSTTSQNYPFNNVGQFSGTF